MVQKKSKFIKSENSAMTRLDEAIRVSFYALIFFLPISIALVGVCAGFAISFYLAKKILVAMQTHQKGFGFIWSVIRPTQSSLDWPLASFIGAVLLSVVFSQYHQLSIIALFGKILRGIYLYSAFIEVFKTQGQITRFIFVWFASACVTGLSGLSQYFLNLDFLRHTPLSGGRVSSSLRQANDFGTYLISICPVLILYLLNRASCRPIYVEEFKQSKIKFDSFIWFLFTICLVLLYCLGLTLSRAAWGAFFVSLILTGILNKKNLIWLFLIGTLFIVLFSPMLLKVRDASLLNDYVKSGSSQQIRQEEIKEKGWLKYQMDHSGNGRWGFWKEALDIINDYPVWGAGLNTYSVMGYKYKIAWGGYPHNSFLQMCAEIGLLGLGSFLWLLFSLFKESYFYLKKNINTYLGALLLGVVGGLSAYLMQSFFDTTFFSVQLSVLFWLMFSLAVAIQRVKT